MVKQLPRLLVVLVVATAATTMGSPNVAAQPLEEEAEARALFNQGLALADADRWAEALSAFRRSSSLVSRASTLYNIANALYRLDRPVEALSELEEHDRMPEVQSDPVARERSVTLRALIHEAVGEVRLTVEPSAALLFVDGSPSVLQGRKRVILLNPGIHFIRVAHEGYEAHRQELELERGSRKAYSIELKPRSDAVLTELSLSVTSSTIEVAEDQPSLQAPSAGKVDQKRFVKRPGFWVMIGAIAAAGVGAGVAVAVVRRGDSPSCGTTGNCATTQGLAVSF